MTKDEALKLALEAMGLAKHSHGVLLLSDPPQEAWKTYQVDAALSKAITAIKEALAQPEQEPVAWLITDEKINSLQVDSIQRLIDRARHAHMTDIKLRINGQDEWYQADWLKHLTRTTPPQRTWVGLTDEDFLEACQIAERGNYLVAFQRIQAALKAKNT
jgi:hypothetical protein